MTITWLFRCYYHLTKCPTLILANRNLKNYYLHKTTALTSDFTDNLVDALRSWIVELQKYARLDVNLRKGANSKHILYELLIQVVAQPKKHWEAILCE